MFVIYFPLSFVFNILTTLSGWWASCSWHKVVNIQTFVIHSYVSRLTIELQIQQISFYFSLIYLGFQLVHCPQWVVDRLWLRVVQLLKFVIPSYASCVTIELQIQQISSFSTSLAYLARFPTCLPPSVFGFRVEMHDDQIYIFIYQPIELERWKAPTVALCIFIQWNHRSLLSDLELSTCLRIYGSQSCLHVMTRLFYFVMPCFRRRLPRMYFLLTLMSLYLHLLLFIQSLDGNILLVFLFRPALYVGLVTLFPVCTSILSPDVPRLPSPGRHVNILSTTSSNLILSASEMMNVLAKLITSVTVLGFQW
jgi:hypothetical protein